MTDVCRDRLETSLLRGLTRALDGAHRDLDRGPSGTQPLLELLPQLGSARPVLPHPLEELVHERDVEDLRQHRRSAARSPTLETPEKAIGLEATSTALQQLLGEPA